MLAFEEDPRWYEYIRPLVPPNVRLEQVAGREISSLEDLIDGSQFDVVVVDGLDRYQASRLVLAHVAPGGAVIIDNAEGFWGDEGTYPIIELFRTHGFSRVDFYGHAPGVILPHCTSLFFKDSCFLLAGKENPVRRPL